MRSNIKICGIMVCCLLLSGCNRVIDWAKESFYQGDELRDYSVVPRQFLRSVKVYDQFETLGIFDVLWLSGPVRTAYAQLHSCRHGKSCEHEKAFLRRQLEENKHFIDFYVLTLYNKPLDGEDSLWSLFLDVDGCRYAPQEIEAIDLSQEYKFFFGKRFGKFKISYMIRFSAQDIENRPLIDENTSSISLVFRSVEKETMLSWDLLKLPCTTKFIDCDCKEMP